MESVYVGWLSIIPPILAIGLALITKEVINSLILGILSGTLIYTLALGGNPVLDTVTYAFTMMTEKVDIGLILVMSMLGAVVEVITLSGGQHAVAEWAKKRFNHKTTSQLATVVVGSCLFLSDVFHNLSTGAIMRTIDDSNRVSRAKLSYILDATAAPVCCLVPMGIWVAGICAVFPENHTFSSQMEIFFANIPYNLYCIISIGMVIYFCFPNRDFGPMLKAELRAEQTGDLGALEEEVKESGKGTVWDMLIPIVALVLGCILFMLYTGGFWSGEGKRFLQAFSDCSTSISLQCGSFVALVVAFVMYVPRKVVEFRSFMDGIYKGIQSMVSGMTIIILAWTIGGVCRQLLLTGDFVANQVSSSGMPVGILPAIIFIIAAALSFATGTSWGTFGILMPIVFNIFEVAAPELLLTAIGSVLGGSVWGDHCSPISDTTVLASTCAGCNHIQHVVTQMPYCVVGGACAVVGYLVAGFTAGNLLLTWVSALVVLVITLIVLKQMTNRQIKMYRDNPSLLEK